jgi:hypothetical protein
MPTRTRSSSKSHRDSGGFDKKLIAYAMAGGAVLAAPAHAGVIDYSGPTLTSTDTSSPIHIGVDGVDFYFAGQTATSGRIANAWWSPGNGKLGSGGLSGPLSAGQPISSLTGFTTTSGDLNYGTVKQVAGTKETPPTYTVNDIKGMVPNGRDTYLGLQLPVNGQTSYGWVLLNASFSGNANNAVGQVQVLDYAYESTPGVPIVAGDTGVPEPSTLALFALGAVGVAAARRRRAKSA